MRSALIVAAAALAMGCVTETHRTKQPVAIESLGTAYEGATYTLAVGPFENRSQYLGGALPDGSDPLGTQAKTLLEMHLKLTGRFVLVDQNGMDETAERGEPRNLPGVAIAGVITQFGRRETGDARVFDVLEYGKQHVAYVTVALNVVDQYAAQVVYAVQATGEYQLTDRELAGFGTVAGYDASLNGKMLNRPIMEAVDNLVAGLDRGEWSPMASPLRGR
jgi:curli biogenesis system outer membrane secretion channel CsgG